MTRRAESDFFSLGGKSLNLLVPMTGFELVTFALRMRDRGNFVAFWTVESFPCNLYKSTL
jgi:hypothetical protein